MTTAFHRPGIFPVAVLAAALLVVAGCAPRDAARDTTIEKDTAPKFEPARFADLPGWTADDHGAALSTFRNSCPRLTRKGAGSFGAAADWQRICADADLAAKSRPAGRAMAARAFFERHFQPMRVTSGGGDPEGLITGYYEPELRGSRKRGGAYTVPLHVRPPDLISVDLSRFSDELKGKRIAGRVVQGRLIPYHDRSRIEGGALNGKKLELVWVDSAADAFFLQIQGSGRIALPNGKIMRVGYAGTNGQPYTAIGRDLIARGAIPREKMSMQAIRGWLADNPADGTALMQTNKSYVFFRELTGPGPIGALGVPLTPGRSLAIDRRQFPLGMPVWLDTEMPDTAATPLRRLMIAQDTGGAIRGAVRADVFWGPGAQAAERAGRMKSPGRYWFLKPRVLAPTS